MLIIYVINIAQSPVSPSPLSPLHHDAAAHATCIPPFATIISIIWGLACSGNWSRGRYRGGGLAPNIHWPSPSTWRTHSKWIDIQLCQRNAPATPLSSLTLSLSLCTVQTTSSWGRGKQLSPPPRHGRAQTINIYLGLQFIFYDIWCGCNCC